MGFVMHMAVHERAGHGVKCTRCEPLTLSYACRLQGNEAEAVRDFEASLQAAPSCHAAKVALANMWVARVVVVAAAVAGVVCVVGGWEKGVAGCGDRQVCAGIGFGTRVRGMASRGCRSSRSLSLSAFLSISLPLLPVCGGMSSVCVLTAGPPTAPHVSCAPG